MSSSAPSSTPISYKDAGVDIVAGDALVERIKPLAKKTMREGVMAGIGGFGALFEVPKRYKEPVLVSGTDGVGTSLHLTAEMLQQQAGLSWTHVPYKSGPQALTELAGGQIDLAVLPVALVQSFVREGKLRGLGVTSRLRAATLPQTPSLQETPVWQSFDVEAWQGLLLPARTDARIAERLARETAAVLAEPDLVRKLAEAGFKPMAMEQAQFIAHLERERKLLEATVHAARIHGAG